MEAVEALGPKGPKGPYIVRELTGGDIQALAEGEAAPAYTQAKPLARLSTIHHQLAKAVAEGRKNVDIAAATGLSSVRISQLKADPAFQELVAHYAKSVDHIYCDAHSRLAQTAVLTLDELNSRLEADPDKFSNRDLKEIAEMALDRSGIPGATKVVHEGLSPDMVRAQVQAMFTRRTMGVIVDCKPEAQEADKLTYEEPKDE